MTDIYEELLAALRQGNRVTMATIVSRSGSTPVPAGAKMLIGEGSRIPVGTVGGGCIEADVIEAARAPGGNHSMCSIRRFVLTEDDVESGMLCGGRVDILLEEVPQERVGLYAELVSRRKAGKDSILVTVIDSGPTILGKYLISVGDEAAAERALAGLQPVAGGLPGDFGESLRGAIAGEAVTRLAVPAGEIVLEPVLGPQDVIIFGGGHVSRFVSRSAAMAGFRVTVVDERPEYANPRRFPEAFRTLAIGFDASWSELEIRSTTSLVIVTRGHKFDERVLERAVQTPARYVGMIGSRRKVLAAFSTIIRNGTPPEQLQRVHAPIGLDIGAETAEEIGISITAELIAVRRGVRPPIGAMSDRTALATAGRGPEAGTPEEEGARDAS
ncbi:MAG TPA: XdhC family protein [Bacteroidota bacterium]